VYGPQLLRMGLQPLTASRQDGLHGRAAPIAVAVLERFLGPRFALPRFSEPV